MERSNKNNEKLENLKRIAVIITIAILFSVLLFSISDIVSPAPSYNDYCDFSSRPRPYDADLCTDEVHAPQEFEQECRDDGGSVAYEYDDDGCQADYYCDTCRVDYEEARSQHVLISFTTVSLLGLLGIFSGVYKKTSGDVADWIFSGFIVGGLASIFIATIGHFGDINRFVRPLVIIGELALVIWLVMRTSKKHSKKR